MLDISKLLESYEQRKSAIKQRLDDFKKEKSKEEIFKELCFCLLTPQSKAKLCWQAIENLTASKQLLDGKEEELTQHLTGVRFPNNKAKYIVQARNITKIVLPENPKLARDWLVKNINGFGMKEASHFLRNIGKGEELAILDRHILKNLKKYEVIKEIPKALSKKLYLEVEEKMKQFANALAKQSLAGPSKTKSFAREIKISLAELDLLFWSEETGEVFK